MSAVAQALSALYERNQEATCYVGNLDLRVTDDILWELFIQCGPVVNVHLPRDKITGDHQGFSFVEFRSEVDTEYAIKIMHMIKLFGKPIKVNKASQDKRTQEVGANLFVGNLSEEVDEKTLKDIFSAFGVVLSTKIMRDPETGLSKRYGFVSYDNFESSDEAIKKLHGQFVSGKPIEVTYAYKEDSKGKEKHGTTAERMLATSRPVPMWTPMMSEMNQSLTGAPSFMNPNMNYPSSAQFVQTTQTTGESQPQPPKMPPMPVKVPKSDNIKPPVMPPTMPPTKNLK